MNKDNVKEKDNSASLKEFSEKLTMHMEMLINFVMLSFNWVIIIKKLLTFLTKEKKEFPFHKFEFIKKDG